MSIFTGKVIVVTGASEGIGRALCLGLAPHNPKLVMAARNEERLESAADQCRASGADAVVVPTDVTDEASCKALMDRAAGECGTIDYLVNNAGGTMWSRFDEVEDLSVYEHLMRLNYLSGVYCTYHALPHLKASGGLIVGVSSLAGMNGVPTRTGYAASKHAQFGFFDSLRIELQGSGVDVTMIAPDFVVSEIHKRAIKADGSPLGESPLDQSKVMTADLCAELIMKGMEKRKRLVIMSARGHFGRWLKLLAPRMIDSIAKRAIESGH